MYACIYIRKESYVYACMHVCIGWMDGWMDGRMDGCMYSKLPQLVKNPALWAANERQKG